MRSTLCLNCQIVWEEDRSIPVEESKCPFCGTKATYPVSCPNYRSKPENKEEQQ